MQLQNEIDIHQRLKHKHICKLKHQFQDDSNLYMVLELCDKLSLNGLLRRRQRLPEAEVKSYMKQIISAVRYLHEENNIMHRDIKPHNIFLVRGKNVKLGDFGISRMLPSSEARCTSAVGTPNYAAPEVVRIICKDRKDRLNPDLHPITEDGRAEYSYSFEADVWSIGAVCFALLFGKPPFESHNRETTYFRILTCKYEFPFDIHVSKQAKCFVDAILTVNPDYR